VLGQFPNFALIGSYPGPGERFNQTLEYTHWMDVTHDLKSETLRQSFAETVAWCGNQQIIASVEETEDVKHRRILGRQAGQLIRRAYMERNRLWNRILRRNYTETRQWRQGTDLYRQADLSSIAPLEGQLRTPSLRPSSSLSEVRAAADRDDIVRSVVTRRSVLVSAQAQSSDVRAGKLLLYVPEENLADGAARYASNGLFDGDNVPPWDTWVAFSQGTLLSWVPPLLIGLAQSGIDVNPEGCIRWID
jgi:hypothetical protein